MAAELKRKGPHPSTPSPSLGEGESRSDGGEGFKPTELGDLPADWEVVHLGDFVAENSAEIMIDSGAKM